MPSDKRVAEAEWEGAPVRPGPFTKALERLAGEVPRRVSTSLRT